MPEEIVAAKRTVDVLQSVPVPTTTDERASAVADAVERAIAAASKGKSELPSVKSIEDAKAKDEATEARRLVLLLARERAEARLVAAVFGRADEIISTSLRNAHAEVIERATKCNERLEDYPELEPDPLVIMAAPEPVRKAWLEMQELAKRYVAIRSARLVWTTASSMDGSADDGGHAEFKQAARIWPNWRPSSGDQPWPTGSAAAKLRWIVLNAEQVAPWLPTPSEQDPEYQSFCRWNKARVGTTRATV